MRQFRAYLADIWRDSGAQLPAAVVLVIAGALLEGIGLLAVLPLSALITGNADTEIGVWAVAAMDNLGLTSELARAFGLTGGFIVLLALRNLVVWRRDTHLFQLGAAYVDRWRVRLLRAIGNADWPTVSRLRRSEFEHAITNDVSRLSSGTDQMLRAGASVAISLVQLLIIAVLSPMLLLLVVVMLGVSLAFTLPLMRRANRLGKRLTKAGRHIYGVLGDFMSSQKLARLSNAEGDFIERFAGSIQDVRMNQTEFISSQIAARGWFQMAAGIIVIAALLIGFFLLKTPLSVLAVTILVLARLVGPVQMIAQTGQSLANALPAFEALKTTLDDLAKAASHAGDAPPVQPKIRGPAALQLQSVGFSYPGSAASVLEDVSLTIEAGEFAALVGPSGAGKTTLLDIASGLIEPDAGVVVADGRILDTEAERRRWREQMAYLPQDPFLFDASLRENLLWSAPDASEADIRNALQIAGIEQMVDQTREGIGTRAGERGQALSGGERQRICLARALLRKPRLLILDEATNALDADLEEAILGRLSKMRDHFSILLITHRAETLRHADRVLRLENGGISAT